MTFLLLAKIFVFPLGFLIVIGLMAILITLIARLFAITPTLILICQIICAVFYSYLYSLWGAYLRSVVLNYSPYLNKWTITFLCIVSIFIFVTYASSVVQSAKERMNEMSLYGSNESKDILSQSTTIVCFSLSPFVFISFIAFSFMEGLYETCYFKYADVFAKSFA